MHYKKIVQKTSVLQFFLIIFKVRKYNKNIKEVASMRWRVNREKETILEFAGNSLVVEVFASFVFNGPRSDILISIRQKLRGKKISSELFDYG